MYLSTYSYKILSATCFYSVVLNFPTFFLNTQTFTSKKITILETFQSQYLVQLVSIAVSLSCLNVVRCVAYPLTSIDDILEVKLHKYFTKSVGM